VLEILGEAAVSIEPGEGAFDDPASWMDGEAGLIGEFADDLDRDRGGIGDARTVIGAVGIGEFDKWVAPA
jgi:hypothetical protein